MGFRFGTLFCLVLGLWSEASVAVECKVKDLTRNCSVFDGDTRERIPLGNGTYVNNPRVRQSAQKPAEFLSAGEIRAREARLRELFQYAQRRMIGYITRGRPASALNESERSLIERIRGTKVDIDTDSGSIGGSNQGMSVLLNGGLLAAPEGLALGIIAHEIGHSVDTCSSRAPVLERGRRHSREELIGQLVEERHSKKSNSIYYESRYPGDSETAVRLFHRLTDEASLPFVLNRTYSTHPVARQLTDSYVARGSLRITAPPVPREANPALPVLQCLDRQGPLRGLTRPLANPRDEEAHVAAQDPQLASDCMSQSGEVIADVWGAKVVADFVRENPPANEMEKIGLAMPAVMEVCDGRSRAPTAPTTRSPRGRGSLQDYRSEHASFTDRFEQIYFDQPAIQEALGCRNPDGIRCSGRFAGGVAAPQTESTAAPSSPSSRNEGRD
ncbi:MAG: hypothetical protein KF767_16585 [Bdellovibrionaceae bacterium]|nr:hypothetical protein [Pseudobdellovibrionaceae bacterium]